jgi:uncharacterized membrane protein YgcG
VSDNGPRGLPPRIYLPIVLATAAIVLGTIGYFLRIALGVTGSAIGPDAPPVAHATPAPIATRVAGEAEMPQSGGVPTGGESLPGNSVGGGGPAAGGAGGSANPSASPAGEATP